MGSVTGYTAEKIDSLLQDQIIGAHLSSDHLILVTQGGDEIDVGDVRGSVGATGSSPLVCTSTSRPTGGDLFEGLTIYETDTKLTYIYNGTDWIYILTKLPKNFGFKEPNSPDEFLITSSIGEDWYSAHPLDVSFNKVFGASHSNILVHLAWSGYKVDSSWCAFWAGVKTGTSSPVSHWGMSAHQTDGPRREFTDILWLTGFDAGLITMRAVMKIVAGSVNFKADFADFFRIEYEEILY